jgi:phospholipid/cholesterol/gamma-HCH transport system ATP-binding protein
MIEAINISKSFEGKEVLKGIDATFSKGQTNLIIGQSGSGKTVFLKTLVGLFEPNSGEIFYDSRNFTKMKGKEKIKMRQEIGMLFQGSALFDSMNVGENVGFPLMMFTDMSVEERLERVNFCLKRVNLVNINHLFPSEISGGMQKRVAIARAISLNPKYLFCDEPNSGLDPKTSIVIDELIKEITVEFDMTTIINTHDMNSVLNIGEYIIFIHNGQKYWEGTSKDIFGSDNKELNDFVFASELLKKVKSVNK